MGITSEHPATAAHVVERRVIATSEDGTRQFVLHVPGEQVTAARAKALAERDFAELGVSDFFVEGDDEPKPVEERPRTAKRPGPKE